MSKAKKKNSIYTQNSTLNQYWKISLHKNNSPFLPIMHASFFYLIPFMLYRIQQTISNFLCEKKKNKRTDRIKMWWLMWYRTLILVHFFGKSCPSHFDNLCSISHCPEVCYWQHFIVLLFQMAYCFKICSDVLSSSVAFFFIACLLATMSMFSNHKIQTEVWLVQVEWL